MAANGSKISIWFCNSAVHWHFTEEKLFTISSNLPQSTKNSVKKISTVKRPNGRSHLGLIVFRNSCVYNGSHRLDTVVCIQLASCATSHLNELVICRIIGRIISNERCNLPAMVGSIRMVFLHCSACLPFGTKLFNKLANEPECRNK